MFQNRLLHFVHSIADVKLPWNNRAPPKRPTLLPNQVSGNEVPCLFEQNLWYATSQKLGQFDVVRYTRIKQIKPSTQKDAHERKKVQFKIKSLT